MDSEASRGSASGEVSTHKYFVITVNSQGDIFRLFLERRQSQEKKYSLHPERSSASFYRAHVDAETATLAVLD